MYLRALDWIHPGWVWRITSESWRDLSLGHSSGAKGMISTSKRGRAYVAKLPGRQGIGGAIGTCDGLVAALGEAEAMGWREV